MTACLRAHGHEISWFAHTSYEIKWYLTYRYPPSLQFYIITNQSGNSATLVPVRKILVRCLPGHLAAWPVLWMHPLNFET